MSNLSTPPAATRVGRPGILRYRIDVWPIALVLGVTAMSVLPFVLTLSTWQLVLIWAAVVYLRTFCAFVQHNHAHLAVFRRGILNRVFDAMLTQNTGYATAIWQLHHNLGHHQNYLSPEQDVAATTLRGTRLSRWAYALRGNLTILRDSVRIALTGPRKTHRPLLVKLGLELTVQVLLTGVAFALNPWLAVWFFLIPNVLTGFLVWWESYPHHLDLPSTNMYDSSMTAEGRDYNALTFNIGHHTAHHQKPTLHWSLLPAQTAKIRHLIHASCIRPEYETWGSRLGLSRWSKEKRQRLAGS